MRRFWRPLKFVALGVLALVAILLIFAAVADYRASARLERMIAELRAAGEPVDLAGLTRKPILPEDNAATYLARAESGILAINKEVYATYEAASEVEQEAFDEGHLTPAMQNAIRSALGAYPQVISLLESAAECTDYDPQLDFKDETGGFTAEMGKYTAALLPHIQNHRAAVRVLNYRALLLLADGNHEEALRTSLIMFRLSRDFERDTMMVGYLVAMACRNVAIQSANLVLRAGPLPDSARDSLDRELALADDTASYQRELKCERAYSMQSFRELASARSRYGLLNFEWLLCGMFKNDACDCLDAFSEQIAAASRPYSELDEGTFRKAGVLTRSLLPSLRAFHAAQRRDQTRIRCLRILNAIQRHEPMDAGEVNLAALGLPAEATIDPINGEPLHVKKSQDGWLIYSAGWNQKDDGGNLDEEKGLDIGLGPPPASKTERKSEDDNK